MHKIWEISAGFMGISHLTTNMDLYSDLTSLSCNIISNTAVFNHNIRCDSKIPTKTNSHGLL